MVQCAHNKKCASSEEHLIRSFLHFRLGPLLKRDTQYRGNDRLYQVTATAGVNIKQVK